MPVIDYKNKPILKPNTFDINKNIQRATCKAIAMHGLGIALYTIEPLDDLDPKVTYTTDAETQNKQQSAPTNKPAVPWAEIDKITEAFKGAVSGGEDAVNKIYNNLTKTEQEHKQVYKIYMYALSKVGDKS